MHARHCGIGNSMQLLLKRAKDVRQMVTTRAPDNLLVDLAQAWLEDDRFKEHCAGIHLFPLGGIGKTAKWRREVALGDFWKEKDSRSKDKNKGKDGLRRSPFSYHLRVNPPTRPRSTHSIPHTTHTFATSPNRNGNNPNANKGLSHPITLPNHNTPQA